MGGSCSAWTIRRIKAEENAYPHKVWTVVSSDFSNELRAFFFIYLTLNYCRSLKHCAFGFLCLHVNFMAIFSHFTAVRLLQMIGKNYLATQNTYSINPPEQNIYHFIVWNKLELYAYTLPVVPFSSKFLSSTSSKVEGEWTVFSGS